MCGCLQILSYLNSRSDKFTASEFADMCKEILKIHDSMCLPCKTQEPKPAIVNASWQAEGQAKGQATAKVAAYDPVTSDYFSGSNKFKAYVYDPNDYNGRNMKRISPEEVDNNYIWAKANKQCS